MVTLTPIQREMCSRYDKPVVGPVEWYARGMLHGLICGLIGSLAGIFKFMSQ